MTNRATRRAGLTAILTLVAPACAHGTGAESGYGPTTGPMCQVRMESDFNIPIEAGARVGAREIQLGVVDPGEAREFAVPCANRAVTVYRVVRAGGRAINRVGAQARALVTDDVTVVTLYPRPGF